MEHSPSNKNNQREENQSGISKLEKVPKLLSYPKYLPFDSTPNIQNILCYVIAHYGYDGLSVLVYRQSNDDQVTVLCGDWYGNTIDLADNDPQELSAVASDFIKSDLYKLLQIMQTIRIDQAQFFFAIDDIGLLLCDMQISLNKFAGPGMIHDIFGKTYRTQEVKKIEVIDERAMEYINRGAGSYSGDLILKPSRFRMYHSEENDYQPFYVEVNR